MFIEQISKKLIVTDFLRWWFGVGSYGALGFWLHFWKLIILYVIDTFSLKILIPAFLTFQPWKKDRTAVGRGVAFFMRFFMILIGLFFVVITSLLAIFVILFWIFLIPISIYRILWIFSIYTF
ncbi:MAG: hypothetical protein Fur0024_4730 [Patescibacteria group bacterium]